MPAAELSLSASPASVGEARGFVVGTLEEWDVPDLAWAAGQVVSELATNAVIHAGTPFTVALALEGAALRIDVRDGSRRMPRQRHYGLDATTGRGLALVGALSREWGIEPYPPGKTVWCVVTDAPAPDGELDLDAFLSPEDRLESDAHGLRSA